MRCRGDLAYFLLAAWATMDPAMLGRAFHTKGKDAAERVQHQVQHGSCTYTFLLPEVGSCHPPAAEYKVSNSLQRDTPSLTETKWTAKRLQQLESILENNTQWLQKQLESYLQESVTAEMSNAHLSAVQNHTVTILEIGTSLLNQTAEQTRKLTDVEMQVLNQTSRLEIQVLENSLSTNKLEKQILLQMQAISRLQERNSFLEKRIRAIEGKREEKLQGLQSEKLEMQQLLSKQMDFIGDLEQRLGMALLNNTALQKQQTSLVETVKSLTGLGSQCNQLSHVPREEQKFFKDCAAAYKSGFISSGVYTLQIPNTTITAKAFCDMETSGGGWMVIQRRKDGSVDFQRNWKEYKMGFGSPHGEYWLGNEFVHLLTTQGSYSLHVRLQDWENNEVYSLYDHFFLGPEKQNYRESQLLLQSDKCTHFQVSEEKQLPEDCS
ncbi:angiopoietin-2-like isoform X3 [Sphaerodactylus townsendi]|uniref:angiopoietin-2-like isoform X3 n=1 Tax=Sphaerodactylus townsendi TaxID=933632 RepID=UPI002026354F|nr:angiopoietin-2-like isoform X3 [Sphaerodactylus townsendi]